MDEQQAPAVLGVLTGFCRCRRLRGWGPGPGSRLVRSLKPATSPMAASAIAADAWTALVVSSDTRSSGLLGVREFPATAAEYAELLDWLRGSGPSPWPTSKGPAVPGRAWPGTWPRPASAWWKWIARTGRTGTGKASPVRWMRSARPGRAQSGRASGGPKGDRRQTRLACLTQQPDRQCEPGGRRLLR